MRDRNWSWLREFSWNALRIVVGLAFVTHGVPKTFGWLGGFGPEGGPAELMTRYGISGVLETFGGLLIVLGLFTRPVAFVLSGEMAVAYFWIHVGGSGVWWWYNSGELAMVYSFIYLLFFAGGAGSFSLDAFRASRRPTSPPGSGA